MEERDEVDQLRDDVEQLRALIRAELELGKAADREFVLATAAALQEKIKRLWKLGWFE
jgi:hypothetical protein